MNGSTTPAFVSLEVASAVKAEVKRLLAGDSLDIDPVMRAALIKSLASSAAFDGLVESRVAKVARRGLWTLIAGAIVVLLVAIAGFALPIYSVEKIVATAKEQAADAQAQTQKALESATAAAEKAAESKGLSEESASAAKKWLTDNQNLAKLTPEDMQNVQSIAKVAKDEPKAVNLADLLTRVDALEGEVTLLASYLNGAYAGLRHTQDPAWIDDVTKQTAALTDFLRRKHPNYVQFHAQMEPLAKQQALPARDIYK